MRITLCLRKFIDQGGQEKFFRRLARELTDHGHRVRVLAIRSEPMDGVEVIPVRSPRHVPHGLRDWIWSRSLANALAKDDHEVSLGEQKTWGSHVIRPGGGVEDDYWISRTTGWRYAWSLPAWVRFLFMKRHLDVSAERRGYTSPRIRAVIANSHLVEAGLMRRYPGLTGKIHVIHNGVNPENHYPLDDPAERENLLNALGMDPAAFTVLFVGYDFRRKGLHEALEVFARAREQASGRPMQFLVVGAKAKRSHLKRIEDLHLNGSVTFTGSVESTGPYYRSADLLLFPSHYDPCANVTLEALAAGLPVITTAENGASELIEEGVQGWIVSKARETEAMARALVSALDPDRLRTLRIAARERALQHVESDQFRAIEEVLTSHIAG